MPTLISPVNRRETPARPPARIRGSVLTLAGLALSSAGLGIVFDASAQEPEAESERQRLVPAEETAAAASDPDWQAPRTAWGDPDLQGTFTSRDMSDISMTRPEEYGMRRQLTQQELRERVSGEGGGLSQLVSSQDNEGRLQLSALDSAETGTRTFGYTSYIIEPADGQMPALTEAGQRMQENRRSGQSTGPFYTMEDFSYYDRCITRGVTGSILPSLYGDAMRIVQSPTQVAITYEMLHDTRIIPLDDRSHPGPNVRQYMGSSVGHWDGDTLVVETTNLTDELTVGRMPHSEDLRLTERFTRIDPDMINYVVTVNDPRTFERPWTFRLTLTTQPDYEILEYACHEGNYFVSNALKAEQQYQQRVREAMAEGEPIPERSTSEGLEIYEAPSAEEAVNINTTE